MNIDYFSSCPKNIIFNITKFYNSDLSDALDLLLICKSLGNAIAKRKPLETRGRSHINEASTISKT
jgi:hypothetical protein